MADCYQEYWAEGVESSLEEHGVTASQEQINAIAKDMQGGHEEHGSAFGSDVIRSSEKSEADLKIEELQNELELEQSKMACKRCGGSGYTPCGSAHRATCLACDGKGKAVPR